MQPQDWVRFCSSESERTVIEPPHDHEHEHEHTRYAARPFAPSGRGTRSRTVSLPKTRPASMVVMARQ